MKYTTSSARKAGAEADFERAREIVAGGEPAARAYAIEALEEYIALNGRGHGSIKTEAQRARYVKIVARGALGCAKAIMADGRAWYEDKDGLVVCTLAADASAGAVGYDRW